MSNINEDPENSDGAEDTLEIATRSWSRVVTAAEKMGYKEGVEDGSDSVFQEGFDKGYEAGFATAFTLGRFKSLLNALPQNAVIPQDIKEILSITRRGACYICEIEKGNNSKDLEKKEFSEIQREEMEHSVKIINRLREYFAPITQKMNIEI